MARVETIFRSAILPDRVFEVEGSRSETYTPLEATFKTSYYVFFNERFVRMLDLSAMCYDAPQQYFLYYFPAFCQDISVTTFDENFDDSILKDYSIQAAQHNQNNQNTPNFEPVSTECPFAPYSICKLDVTWKGIARPTNWTLQETLAPEVGMRQLPTWGYYWRSDASPALDAEAPALIERKATITRDIQGVRGVPKWFFQLAGRTNSNEWQDGITKIWYQPDTLLFVPTNMSRSISMQQDQDDRLWNFSFDLKWNPIGWNTFVRPHGFDWMLYNGQRVWMYPPIPFGNLNGLQKQQALDDPPPRYRIALPNYDGSYYVIDVDEKWNTTLDDYQVSVSVSNASMTGTPNSQYPVGHPKNPGFPFFPRHVQGPTGPKDLRKLMDISGTNTTRYLPPNPTT